MFGFGEPCAGCYLQQLDARPFPGRFIEVRADDRLFALQLIPVGVKDGRKQFIELIEDRTHRDKVKASAEEIARLNSIIAFARTIGHELNQPLTGISGYCALLKEEVDKESSVYQDIHEIEQQALRLERIVNKFQSVTHLDYKDKKRQV
jgi:signal transduction histidine kinase